MESVFLARPLRASAALPRASTRRPTRVAVVAAAAPDRKPPGAVASTTNYVVPLDAAPSGITRPLVEILRDLNKRVPDTIVRPASRRASASDAVIPWYHANRMLSFYAPALCSTEPVSRLTTSDALVVLHLPIVCLFKFTLGYPLRSGWCGEVRDVIYTDNGKVTVIYRVTVRGTDGEVYREAAGTASLKDARFDDPVAAAEEAAFCKACARFGFGLYLYDEDETP
ncbi:unnamed protein product [Urochloa decumbens]|uniref:SnRK1-interacting protein 1 n=1 Tax=Urochloa decumbens TaxID=240449 RepID=A0ABC8X335_9POAL